MEIEKYLILIFYANRNLKVFIIQLESKTFA